MNNLPDIDDDLVAAIADRSRHHEIDPRAGRLRALRAIGRAFEVAIYIDSDPPIEHVFSKPPTMQDIAALIGELNLDSHVVSIRMSTHDFAIRVPDFCNPAKTPRIHQEAAE